MKPAATEQAAMGVVCTEDEHSPQIPATVPQLKAANDWRRIKKQCLPMFDLASGRSEDVQESVYCTMVLQIAAVLGVEAPEKDLSIHSSVVLSITPDISKFSEALGKVADRQHMFSPGGVDPQLRFIPYGFAPLNPGPLVIHGSVV